MKNETIIVGVATLIIGSVTTKIIRDLQWKTALETWKADMISKIAVNVIENSDLED